LTVIKSIVVCLALANIGFFLWTHGIGQSQAVPAAASPNERLQLASEAPAQRPTAAAGSDPDIANSYAVDQAGVSGTPVAGTPVNVRRCVTVGPFNDVSEAAHAASTLRGGGYDPRQRVVDGDVWTGVWVYLPLPATHPASDQMLAKLKAAGIDESLLMPGPGDGSVVSLGMFSEQKRAQTRVAQVQALGLNPGVADRKRAGILYWIDLDLKPTDRALNTADLQDNAGHINRLEVKACPAAAAQAPAAAS
jgi:hypothetical protein